MAEKNLEISPKWVTQRSNEKISNLEKRATV